MALRLIRRHQRDCPHTSTRYRRCRCPIHVYGTLAGEKIRKALDLTSWEAASELVRRWEASGEIGLVKPDVPTVSEAIERFFADCTARNLRPPTIDKYKLVLQKQLVGWCQTKGYRQLKQLDVDAVRRFRETWRDSAISAGKKLERLRTFFRFCHSSGWVRTNPALAVKPPKADISPTLPFTDDQVSSVLQACERFPPKGIYGAANGKRLKALALLLRYSGLRIRDAVTLRRERIKDGRLFLYTQKTGTPVWVPLPEMAVQALDALTSHNVEYFFWTGNGKAKSAVSDAQRSFRRLFTLAGVTGHPHMFRDTFAVSLLEQGVPLETVSILLGHSSTKITERHYKPWVKSLQDKLEFEVKKTWQSIDVQP